jgi:hypothetical protein
MRKWFKFSLKLDSEADAVIAKDNSFEQHKNAMGGYNTDDSYISKTSFFEKYYHGFHFGRLENYNTFLRKHIQKNEKLLSIASGRSANELFLLEDGFDITCSDLSKLPCYDDTLKLFSGYKFYELDIINSSAESRYDGILALSLVYLFDDDQLDQFFRNINSSLNNEGYLILDSAGSPDNLISYLFNDLYLRFELSLFCLLNYIKNLGRKRYRVVAKHHGYRRSDNDFIQIAERNGFSFILREDYSFLNDFKRSILLSKLADVPILRDVLNCLGKRMPYSRLFLFKKT